MSFDFHEFFYCNNNNSSNTNIKSNTVRPLFFDDETFTTECFLQEFDEETFWDNDVFSTDFSILKDFANFDTGIDVTIR